MAFHKLGHCNILAAYRGRVTVSGADRGIDGEINRLREERRI